MKTLQDQYKLIKEGKGHKGVFLKEAKQMFPNYIRNAATFEEASNILKDKNVISENLVGIEPINTISRKKESYETAFENFLKEARKKNDNDPNAEIKKVSQQVEDKLKHNFDRTDKKNPDNQIFGEIMKGYYCEMKDPKNVDKTEEQLRDIVLKNLAKDPIYYTKNGMFGEKGVGVEMDVPGLGEPKEPKGKYKSSGYGDLKESKTNKVESLQEQKVRKVINSMIKQELISENKKYQKTIKEIEKASKLAELTTKMEALNKAIEEKNSRLNSIEESEEMKELVDNKAIKELKKEVKLLEKYSNKVEKMYEKLTKTKNKEVIGEDESIDEGETQDALAASEKTPNDISGKKTFNDFYEEAEKEMGLPRGANNQGAHDLAYMRWKQYKEDNNIQEVEDEIIEKEINEGPKEDSSSEIKTNWEEIKKIVDDIEKTDLFEEDENMPSKDEAFKMKAELESYLDKVGSAEEAVDLYIENHPEDIIHKTFLLRIAKMAVFDEEVE